MRSKPTPNESMVVSDKLDIHNIRQNQKCTTRGQRYTSHKQKAAAPETSSTTKSS